MRYPYIWVFPSLIFFFLCVVTVLPTHPSISIRACFTLSAVPLLPSIPAETYLLVQHQSPLQRPMQPVVKPALTAENWWQADGCCHITGWSTLPQVRQEKARPGALTHCIQSSWWLLVANVAHSLTQICRVTELLQFEGGERGAIVAAAVEHCWKVAVGQCRFTQL